MNTIKISVIFIFLVSLFALGCLNADIGTKINKDYSGMRTLHAEMNPFIYGILEKNMSREEILSKEAINNGASIVKYEKNIKGDKVILDVVIDYKDIRKIGSAKIYEKDNKLIYEDSFTDINPKKDERIGGTVLINYTLEMPSKIDKSNADKVEGNKAIWIITGNSGKVNMNAESNVPSTPGFDIIISMIAIISITLVCRTNIK